MKQFFVFIMLCCSFTIYSQNNDCDEAEVVCSSESFDFNPDGSGSNDLNTTTQGCLVEGEHSSAWYYFQINEFAPNNTSIAFLIIPENGSNQDYDFALYGPDVTCDNLGAPIRCSFAATSPSTGLDISAVDFSEGTGGDGYVAPIIVNPGEGYFLLIDNYGDDGVGFQMEWAGNGADFLDCNATPPCAIDIQLTKQDICTGTALVDYEIELSVPDTEYTVNWTSDTGNEAWLSDPNILDPIINVPADFTGDVSFTVEISFTEINCIQSETFTTTIFPYPVIEGLENELIYCSNDLITIGPSNNFDPNANFNWTQDGSPSGSTSLIETNEGGEYILEVELNNCPTFDTLIVEKIGEPIDLLQLYDSTDICEGIDKGLIFIEEIQGGTAPYTFELNTGEISNDFTFPNLPGGNYMVTITDVDGCSSESSIEIPEYIDTKFNIGNDTLINLGSYIDLQNKLNIDDADILFSEWLFNNNVFSNDTRGVNFKPREDGILIYNVTDVNGCYYEDSIKIRILVQEQIYIANAFSPNDDNVNDRFYVQGGPSVSHVNSLEIYSRWGEMVYATDKTDINDPSSGWDGTHHDKTLNPASFVYITEVELINGDKFMLTGTVALIR